jgi:hypothetical protein
MMGFENDKFGLKMVLDIEVPVSNGRTFSIIYSSIFELKRMPEQLMISII